MISQQKDRIVHSLGYNVLLTITSLSDIQNLQVAAQFEQQTGLNLNIPVPGLMQEAYSSSLNSCLDSCLRQIERYF